MKRLEFIVTLQHPLCLTILIFCLLLNSQIFWGMKLDNFVVSMFCNVLGDIIEDPHETTPFCCYLQSKGEWNLCRTRTNSSKSVKAMWKAATCTVPKCISLDAKHRASLENTFCFSYPNLNFWKQKEMQNAKLSFSNTVFSWNRHPR